jgi:hypothetical protein
MQQLELEDLAAVLAAKEFGADLGNSVNQSINTLVKILTCSSSSELSLQQRVE